MYRTASYLLFLHVTSHLVHSYAVLDVCLVLLSLSPPAGPHPQPRALPSLSPPIPSSFTSAEHRSLPKISTEQDMAALNVPPPMAQAPPQGQQGQGSTAVSSLHGAQRSLFDARTPMLASSCCPLVALPRPTKQRWVHCVTKASRPAPAGIPKFLSVSFQLLFSCVKGSSRYINRLSLVHVCNSVLALRSSRKLRAAEVDCSDHRTLLRNPDWWCVRCTNIVLFLELWKLSLHTALSEFCISTSH